MKEAVACVVYRDRSRCEVLMVLRPEDDPDLPGVWGFPAVSRRPGESWEGAVARIGRDKLGVPLRTVGLLAEGEGPRGSEVLHMRLYEARVEGGGPRVPQPARGVTQYPSWRWGGSLLLEPGARQGSLCCRLFLEVARHD